jgi:hypothetical protein
MVESAYGVAGDGNAYYGSYLAPVDICGFE